MATPNSNGPELLRREILEEARRQRDEILRSARETAERLVEVAEAAAEQARNEKLDAARVEATRQQDAILATISVEMNRMRLARIEELLQSIHDRAREQLQQGNGFDRREVLAGLAAQALARMAGQAFVLRLSKGDLRTVGQDIAEKVKRGLARPSLRLALEEGPEATDGDCILQDEEGHQRWDIGLGARLERLWPAVRRQIAAQAGLVEQDEPREDQA